MVGAVGTATTPGVPHNGGCAVDDLYGHFQAGGRAGFALATSTTTNTRAVVSSMT